MSKRSSEPTGPVSGGYVLVTGPPASGKTTLARRLAPELGLPLLAKDTIKAALLLRLGAADVEASRELGRAAVAVLLAVAEDAGMGVLESVWVDRDAALPRLAGLPGGVVEVFCRCDPALLRERYAARAVDKPPGHFDLDRTPGELWADPLTSPLGGPWPLLEVDTSQPVDVPALADRVRGRILSR